MSNDWLWPASLDALIASPEHHKLLMENDRVRVLETVIKPGEITNLHTHRFPATLYVISWSDFIRYDANGNVMVDSRKLPNAPTPSSVLWTESLEPHTLENTGDRLIHVISVELKS